MAKVHNQRRTIATETITIEEPCGDCGLRTPIDQLKDRKGRKLCPRCVQFWSIDDTIEVRHLPDQRVWSTES